MKCPWCGTENNYVRDSRSVGNRVWRRRVCEDCKNPFATYETYIPRNATKREKQFAFEKGRKGRESEVEDGNVD